MSRLYAPTTGGAAFFGVKLIGYSIFASYLNWLYGRRRNVVLVAVVRAALGALSLTSLTFILFKVLDAPGGIVTLYPWLILARMFTWGVIVILFYDRRLVNRRAVIIAIVAGTILSSILDLPAIVGLLAFGGAEMC